MVSRGAESFMICRYHNKSERKRVRVGRLTTWPSWLLLDVWD
jgi:hypothetical protein